MGVARGAVAVTRGVALWVAALVLTALVTLALALTGVRVADRAELADVGFGRPVVWLHQDRSATDPPLPATVRPGLPQEHPTRVSPGALLTDLALVGAVPAALVLTVQLRARSRRTRSHVPE